MFHSLYNQTAGSFPSQTEQPEKAGNGLFLDWPATYLDGFEKFDPDHWQLEVAGLVEKSQSFTLKDLGGLMRIQQNRRLVFADGWSYRATWEGFVVQELLHRVAPKPEAQFLVQTDLSGRTECIPLKDLYAQRALFCMRIGGKPLPAIYGGPLRLLVFDRYAHKGMGQLARLELTDTEVPDYFASKGYSTNGEIEPGNYYAADLKSFQSVKVPGEVTQW